MFKNVFKTARVLITGHTGFKGCWLSLWLQHLGAEVYGISIDIPTEPSFFKSLGLTSSLNEDHRFDICDDDLLRKTVSDIKPDFIFHLAAQPLVRKSFDQPLETWRTNTFGSLSVLDALRGLKNNCTVIMITSDKSYDNVEWEWGYRETDALGGPDPYSASKGGAELAIRSYVRSYFNKDSPIRLGVGRAGNVIGGGDWAQDRIVPDCMIAWAQGNTVKLRNPSATRPWQHVLEPLSGYLNMAAELHSNASLHGEAFNFGPVSQQNHSVGELVEAMTKHWSKVVWEDVSANYGGPHESGLLKLNCDKALHFLKWQPTWGFNETVYETVSWYKNFFEQPFESIKTFSLNQIESYENLAKQKNFKWTEDF